MTLDDDMQIAPGEIEKLITAQQAAGHEMVYGIFKSKKHKAYRRLGSKFIERLLAKFGSTPGSGSSFKLIHHSLIEKVLNSVHFFVYVDELLSWHTTKIGFVQVEHNERSHGKSGYNFFKLVQMSLRIIFNYTVVPLRIMTYFGLTASLVSFGLGVFFIIKKLSQGAEVGFTALIVSVFFATGLILFCLGILGEYMAKMLALQGNKPSYQIKQVI